MKTFYSSFILLFFAVNAVAQCAVSGTNLIPNSSFELTTAFCTGADNQVYVDQSPLQNWIGTDPISVGGSTPDITRNDATTCGSSVNAFNNNCFTGTKCAGFFVKTSFANGREYIQTALTTPLTAGTTYCFSMTVRSRYGAAGNLLLNTDGVGAHFRNGGAINIQTMNGGSQFIGPGSTLNLTPQIQQTAGTVITNACTIVTGTFVATGGENRVIIGNFRNDAATTTSGSSSASYMYIDDVRLYPTSVLPIELMEFKASCAEEQVLINWSTSSERDNAYFTLEHSCDGASFEEIAIINGAGNSTVKLDYTFGDALACSGIHYYRLSQTDFNGNREVFKVISTECSASSTSPIYPNPATTQFTFINTQFATTQLKLFSSNGELVRDYSNQLTENQENQVFDLQGISSGIYLLQVTGYLSNPITYKLVIQ